jgi:O-antigen/teichoic acid export membrane protein
VSEDALPPTRAGLAVSDPSGRGGDDGDDSTVAHRVERSRRLKWSIVTALLTKPVAFITPIITVPLFLHYLGKEGYGLFANIGALTIWLSLSNAGLTLGLLNRLTECHVSGDRALAQRYVSTLLLMLVALTALITVLVSAAVPFVDWSRVFKASSPDVLRDAPLAVWLAALATVFGLVFSVGHPIYSAYQENHRNNVWDGLSKVLTLAACIAVVRTSWGLPGVVLAAAGTNTLVRMINMVVLFSWEKPWLTPRLRFFDRTLLAGTVRQGLGLFVISAASMSIFQVDKLIIGAVLGQDGVADYDVVARPFLIVFGLYSVLLGPRWPAYGEALRRGDVDWVRRALRRSLIAGVGGMTACGAAMFFFGDRIIDVWTRGEFVQVSRHLVVAMTALFVLWTWMGGLSILLNSAGVLRGQMWVMSLHAVLNVILAFPLARHFGVTGVAWSMTITGLLSSVWGYPWILRKHVYQRDWTKAPPPPPPLIELPSESVAPETAAMP